MTQQEVAEKLCVTRQAVSNWETGKTQPDFDMLRSIAEIYCVSLNDLFGSEDSQLTGDDSLMTHIQKEDSNTKISKKNLSKNKYYNSTFAAQNRQVHLNIIGQTRKPLL